MGFKDGFVGFSSREWTIFVFVVVAIVGGNIINLIFNILKYQAAIQNPVISISQSKLTGKFPAFTLGICADAIFGASVNITGLMAYPSDPLAPIVSPFIVPNNATAIAGLVDNCWLLPFPELNFGSVTKNTKGQLTYSDSYTLSGRLALDTGFNYSATTQLTYIFALPGNKTTIPDDFDLFDFSNQFVTLFSGFFSLVPCTVQRAIDLKNVVTDTFVLSPFKNIISSPNPGENGYFDMAIDARGLNRQVTISQEQSTFGLAALFSALLSIFNISLTVYVFIFPTQPLVLAHTYFRFKDVAMLDPTKLKNEEAMVSSKSRAASRNGSRPASPGPKDEVHSPFKDDNKDAVEMQASTV